MRLFFAGLVSLFLLAGCATHAAPVRYGAPVEYGPPVNYGPPGDPGNPPAGAFQPNAYLRACGAMYVTNAPPLDGDFWVADFKPVIVVDGIVLVTIPANDVCLSSGFGVRAGNRHDGVDLQARPAVPVYAAAPGRILEARVSSGYGNQVLIDHGNGVYTRYAHLEYFAPGVAPGATIGFGQPVGHMGQSGNATAIHLHFELLTGDYNNPKGSKGLFPRDPFNFPAYDFGS